MPFLTSCALIIIFSFNLYVIRFCAKVHFFTQLKKTERDRIIIFFAFDKNNIALACVMTNDVLTYRC